MPTTVPSRWMMLHVEAAVELLTGSTGISSIGVAERRWYSSATALAELVTCSNMHVTGPRWTGSREGSMTSVALNSISLLAPSAPRICLFSPGVLTPFPPVYFNEYAMATPSLDNIVTALRLIAFRILRTSVNVAEDERDGYYYHATVEEGPMGSTVTLFLVREHSANKRWSCDSIKSRVTHIFCL